MEMKIYKLYHGGALMPWGMATRVTNAKGFVFVAGCEGQDPTKDWRQGGTVVEGAEAQTRLALQKMKERLEEAGTSLDYMVHMTWYVRGPFPEGTGVVDSPNFREEVAHEFFKEHCPKLCLDNNPITYDLVGVASLALKDMLVEIGCIAAIPDD